MKKTKLSISLIEIPYSRLPSILKPGDLIFGHDSKIKSSFYKIYFVVTHVDWWGVMAVPSPETMEYLTYQKDKIKGHQKFKWQNIQGLILSENQMLVV